MEAGLNQAEIEISLFARQCLGKRRIPDLKMLQRETRAWKPPDESPQGQNQLAVRPQDCTPQVRLQEIPFHAVKDLVLRPCERVRFVCKDEAGFPAGELPVDLDAATIHLTILG